MFHFKSKFYFFLILILGVFNLTSALETVDQKIIQSNIADIDTEVILLSNYGEHIRHNPLSSSVFELIDRAEKSILIMTFTLSNPEVIQKLNQKAEEGIEVIVMIDKDHLCPSLSPLIKVGTREVGEGHLHHKILVVDQEYIYISSANFTTDSLVSTRNLGVVYRDPAAAAALHQEAKLIDLSIKRNLSTPPICSDIGGQHLELYMLPHYNPDYFERWPKEMNDLGLEQLVSLINRAKESLKISVIVWTLKDVSKAVINAEIRGVDVQVVTGGLKDPAIQMLWMRGIPVKASSNHYKWMLVDNKILLNGSANWSKNAFSRSDESFIILYDLTPKQLSVMDAVWNDLMQN